MFTNELSFTRIFLAKKAKGAKIFLGELSVFARVNVSSCLVCLRLGLASRRQESRFIKLMNFLVPGIRRDDEVVTGCLT